MEHSTRRLLAGLLLLANALPAAPPIKVHGHRGARASRPENTIPAFEFAISVGADVLEMDVSVTKDDVLVLSHDPRLNPELCVGAEGRPAIRELTLEQLRRFDCGSKKLALFPDQVPVPGTRIPTLDEVLALAPRGNFGFNIETKISPKTPELAPPPDKFAQLLAEVIQRNHLASRVIVQSFDYRTLHAMKKLLPQVRLSALESQRQVSFVELAREAGATIVSPHLKLVTPEKVAEAKRAGLEVAPWTANAPQEWDRLIQAGVDAMITDDPAGLIAFLKQHGYRR
jgi:glycerophosphoryl diester phosphodiesterase